MAMSWRCFADAELWRKSRSVMVGVGPLEVLAENDEPRVGAMR